MATEKPEAPESSRERDALRRWPFAHSIYQLIQRAPKPWSLRIGIFGRWGEGKTTVLNYIGQMAEKDHCPVARFNPWAAQNRKELWEGFAIAVENAFDTGSVTRTMVKRRAGKAAKAGLQLAAMSNVGKAIGGLVGPLVQEKLSVNRNDVEQNLKNNLGERKLITLIDDLDRADPKLVPHLLLGLREVFDLPQCAFIMSLDPVVVSNALGEVHSGWGKTDEFLEKIIDFPFWLPPVQDHDIRRLLDQELKNFPVKLDRSALAEVAHLLPINPRKLKRFLRGLWRFNNQIGRHDDAEIEWILLLLIELLRTVSFKSAERLLANKELWDEVQKSVFAGRLPDPEDKDGLGEEQWIKIMAGILDEEKEKEQCQREAEKSDFLKVVNAMKDLVPIHKWNGLDYWVRFEDEPPIFTWKEFQKLFDVWKGNPTGVLLDELIRSQANRLETNVAIVAKDLFETVITYREQLLDKAAQSGSDSELVELVTVAHDCLSMINVLVIDLGGFSGRTPSLLASNFKDLLNHVAKWAHFTNHPAYIQARAEEADALKLAAEQASSHAVEILDEIKLWDPFRGLLKKEAQALHDNLLYVLTPKVILVLRDRFIRKDGINSLWGYDRHLVEKWFLFRRNSGFYSEEGLRFLEEMVQRARTDVQIHSNLLEFILMLDNGLRNGFKIFSMSDLHPLASAKGIVPLI